jgi:hypothetical protein
MNPWRIGDVNLELRNIRHPRNVLVSGPGLSRAEDMHNVVRETLARCSHYPSLSIHEGRHVDPFRTGVTAADITLFSRRFLGECKPAERPSLRNKTRRQPASSH